MVGLEEIQALVDGVTTAYLRSLIGFLYVFGCRINEALRLRRKDIQITEDSVAVSMGYSKRRDKTKQDTHCLEATVSAPLIQYVVEWVSKLQDGEALVWGDETKRDRGYWRVWKMFNDLPQQITPHCFRHARATKLASRPDVSLSALREWHGWKGVSTAQSYLEETGREARRLKGKLECSK